MLALLAAATVAAAAPPQTERMPNLYSAPAHCENQPYKVVDRYGRPAPILLRDLPKAGAQLLVDRQVNGCRVITLMSGKIAPWSDQPNPPRAQYRVWPAR